MWRTFKRTRSRGFTLLEVLVTLAIFSVVMSISVSFLFQHWRTQRALMVQNYLRERTQSTLYVLSRQLSQSKRIFGNDTLGNLYRSQLPFPTAERDRIVLPTIRTTGALAPERTCDVFPDQYFWAPSVGNALFFVENVEVFDDFDGLPLTHMIDLYRFNLYYVIPDSGVRNIDHWNNPSQMPAQKLVEWHSELYADYNQFKRYLEDPLMVSSSDRDAAKLALENRGVTALWDTKEETDKAKFFVTMMSDPAVRTNKGNAYQIEEKIVLNALRLQSDQQNIYSIAYNRQPDGAQANYFPIKTVVPAFFNANPTPDAGSCGANALPATAPTYFSGPANAFPGGFEVAITGPNSGRSVLLNLTVLAQGNGKMTTEQNHQAVAYAKDY